MSEAERTEQGNGRGEPDEILVTKWCPLELSVVSVAADPGVGIGREGQKDFPVRMLDRTRVMNESAADIDIGAAEQLPAAGESAIEVVRAQTRSEELRRTKLILESGRC